MALGHPKARAALETQPNSRPMAIILDHFTRSDTPGGKLDSSLGTGWGLLNAATYWADHEAGRSQDTRLASAWFGENDSRKVKVLAAVKQLVAA